MGRRAPPSRFLLAHIAVRVHRWKLGTHHLISAAVAHQNTLRMCTYMYDTIEQHTGAYNLIPMLYSWRTELVCGARLEKKCMHAIQKLGVETVVLSC